MTTDSDIGRIVRERIRTAAASGRYTILELSQKTGLSTEMVARIINACKPTDPGSAA